MKSTTIRLTSLYPDGPMKLSIADTPLEHYRVELKEIEPGKVFDLTATTTPPLPSGPVAEMVHLTSGPAVPQDMKVRVNGYVVPLVRVTPAHILVSPKTTFPSVKDVSIVYRTEQPIAIERIECNDARVKWEQLDPPQRTGSSPNAFHRLRVTVPPAARSRMKVCC